MIININIDTKDALSENDKVILLALAGEISLDETKPTEAVVFDEPSEDGPKQVEETVEEPAEEPEAAEEAPEEEPKAKKPVNVTEATLKKYGFSFVDGEVKCDHCDFVSETGRALHLHAGTHEEAPKEGLKAVPTPKDEPGVDAFTSTEEPEAEVAEDEPEPEDVADAEAAAAGDPEPEVAEVPEPPKTVDPKELRDTVAKIATEMVAKGEQGMIRPILDDLGVARVSMIAESDLQTFLDRITKVRKA